MLLGNASGGIGMPPEPRDGLTRQHQNVMESTAVDLRPLPFIPRPPADGERNQNVGVGLSGLCHRGKHSATPNQILFHN